MMQIEKLQYITNYQSKTSHFEQVKKAVDGGAKWIQFRPKESDKDTILAEGKEIAAFCKEHNVIFIMNDNVEIAMALNADGVHLGKSDMPADAARKIIGSDKIIGGTSNTLDDILNLISQGVNYVGLGPFQYTETKKNLSPVLGTEGYKNIIEGLQNAEQSIPIVAIGGIKEKDIEPILKTGVYGVAISSLISEAKDIAGKTNEILHHFKRR